MNASSGAVSVGVTGLSTPLTGRALLTRLDGALRATGRRVSPYESSDPLLQLQFGWEPGAVPLRPLEAEREDVRAALEDPGDRPVAWCLVDETSPGACRLAEQLTASADEGIVYLAGVMGHSGGLPGLPAAAIDRLLRAASLRFWSTHDPNLDAVRVLESAARGCVPCQAMPPKAAASLRERLPRGLRSLVIDVTPAQPLVCPSAADLAQIRAELNAELLSSSLEEDLRAAGV